MSIYGYCTGCVKRYNLAIVSTRLSSTSEQNQIIAGKFVSVQNKVYDLMKWYEQLTGIDEIRFAQNKVIEAQDRFAAAQEKRREVTIELNDVKNKIKDLQEEITTVNRGEERFINLITKEHKLLKEEIRLTDKFNLYEREERELFTTLTASVKDSHEKERIQANKTKYLSIIGSVIGALIGIMGSTWNNRSKMAEVKQMVLKSTEDSKQELASVCKQLEETSKDLKNSAVHDNLIRELQDISAKFKNVNPDVYKMENVEFTISRLESKLNLLLKKVENVTETEESTDVPQPSDFEIAFPYLASIKDDISYAVISCFSIYFVYKLFFP